MNYEKNIDGFLFSNDKSKLDIISIHHYLCKESYWAQNISLEKVKATIEGSDCYGIYILDVQVGFARVITDHASFGYLADVFILDKYRGKGLSKHLLRFILDYEPYKELRRFMLATKDAHTLYEKFGFTPLSTPDRFMELKPFEKYPD